MTKAVLIGAGGFVGSVLRYAVGGLAQSAFGAASFPFGTFAVNVTGCFAIGLAAQAFETQTASGVGARAFLIVGVLGGYTTFSTFGHETVELFRAGQRLAAVSNAGGQLCLALAAVWVGRMVGEMVWG